MALRLWTLPFLTAKYSDGFQAGSIHSWPFKVDQRAVDDDVAIPQPVAQDRDAR